MDEKQAKQIIYIVAIAVVIYLFVNSGGSQDASNLTVNNTTHLNTTDSDQFPVQDNGGSGVLSGSIRVKNATFYYFMGYVICGELTIFVPNETYSMKVYSVDGVEFNSELVPNPDGTVTYILEPMEPTISRFFVIDAVVGNEKQVVVLKPSNITVVDVNASLVLSDTDRFEVVLSNYPEVSVNYNLVFGGSVDTGVMLKCKEQIADALRMSAEVRRAFVVEVLKAVKKNQTYEVVELGSVREPNDVRVEFPRVVFVYRGEGLFLTPDIYVVRIKSFMYDVGVEMVVRSSSYGNTVSVLPVEINDNRITFMVLNTQEKVLRNLKLTVWRKDGSYEKLDVPDGVIEEINGKQLAYFEVTTNTTVADFKKVVVLAYFTDGTLSYLSP